MTMTVEHFKLHRTIARAIDEGVQSRPVWLHISVRAPRNAHLDDPPTSRNTWRTGPGSGAAGEPVALARRAAADGLSLGPVHRLS